MKVELTPDSALWVEAEIAAGTFPTPEDAVREALNALRANTLRAKLDAAVAEGGRHSGSDVLVYVREHLENRAPKGSLL